MSILLLSAFVVLFGCTGSAKFPPLGKRVASPVDVAVSDSGEHFYVLNSDYDRSYDRGSILVLDGEGKKLRAVSVPRMGRNIAAADARLLLTFDRSTATDSPSVHLYSLADPSKPVLRKRWEIDCLPLNTVIRRDFDYFFISCVRGELFIGNSRDLSLKLVRNYRYPRRALHLDPQRGLLFAFPTMIGRKRSSDVTLEDRFTYVDDGMEQESPDKIPDAWANSPQLRRRARAFQYAIYDIFAARTASPTAFPSREDDLDDELHWIYYPRWSETSASSSKTYRTNFYDAHADPSDPDSFYLSQRGALDSTSNNIVRATLNATKRLEFQVIHSAEADDALTFPGDIEVLSIDTKKTLLVNSFRDFVNWPRQQVFFSITARMLTQANWQKSCSSTVRADSYFRFAANAKGTVVVASFYGDRINVLRLHPENDFVCTADD